MSFAAALFSLCCRDSVVRPRAESKGRRGNRERQREKDKIEKEVDVGEWNVRKYYPMESFSGG